MLSACLDLDSLQLLLLLYYYYSTTILLRYYYYYYGGSQLRLAIRKLERRRALERGHGLDR
jgi:hypothetical protein